MALDTRTSTRKSAAALKPKKPARSIRDAEVPRVVKQKRVRMSYRVKMLIFALTLITVLMIYMFSFILGTQIGITVENISTSVLAYIFGKLNTLLTMTGVGVLSLAGSGLVKLFSIGPIAVVTCGSVLAYIVSTMVSIIVSLHRTYLAKQSNERKFLPTRRRGGNVS